MLRTSAAAISLFVFPAVTCRSTSTSRTVSPPGRRPPRPAGGGGGGGPPAAAPPRPRGNRRGGRVPLPRPAPPHPQALLEEPPRGVRVARVQQRHAEIVQR